jgi:glycosyltransferase involved in cell wall biosynthesis
MGKMSRLARSTGLPRCLGSTLKPVAEASFLRPGRHGSFQAGTSAREKTVAKTNILFMQSQSYFGSDSLIHSLIMRHLDRERFTVHVACNRGTRQVPSASLKALSEIPDLNIRPTSFGPSVNFASKNQIAVETLKTGPEAVASLGGLVAYARKHNIDIIHGTEKPRDAFYGELLSRATGAASIVHLHVGVNPEWMLPLTQWAMKHADGLIGVSDFVAGTARDTGHDPDRVFSVLNAIDATKWDPSTDGSRIRTEFGIPADMPVMAIISRVYTWKGHTQLLEALAKIKAEFDHFKLLLVGEDDVRATPGHTSYLTELHQMVDDLGLQDQVVFTGFRTDVRELLAASDIYTMPSYEEPCAVAYLEAMAMAKPVIALTSGGTVQLVDHGGAGLLSEPWNVDELASNLRSLLVDAELRRRMGTHARQRVEELFNPPRLARDIEVVYGQVLEAKASRRRRS